MFSTCTTTAQTFAKGKNPGNADINFILCRAE